MNGKGRHSCAGPLQPWGAPGLGVTEPGRGSAATSRGGGASGFTRGRGGRGPPHAARAPALPRGDMRRIGSVVAEVSAEAGSEPVSAGKPGGVVLRRGERCGSARVRVKQRGHQRPFLGLEMGRERQCCLSFSFGL